MKRTPNLIPARLLLMLLLTWPTSAQTAEGSASFDSAAEGISQRLEASLHELDGLRTQVAADMIPRNRRLSELEQELSATRVELQQTSRELDSRSLSLANLRDEITYLEGEGVYLTNLLGEYARKLETRLHIVEQRRYADVLQSALLALENDNLTQGQVYELQVALLGASLQRLNQALGGARFAGTAVDADGLMRPGTFLLVGPAALFRSEDGTAVGAAESRLGSQEAAIVPFSDPALSLAASRLVQTGEGVLPLDVSLGNAHKLEEIESESLMAEVAKGGPIMWPIFLMAAAALLVALGKWIGLSLVRRPNRRQVDELLTAVSKQDRAGAERIVASLPGPAGAMLASGVAHLGEPRELVEEILYETVLTTRLKLERFLPFIAICAASAPLLGLLGTVTGIINTFKLITLFGSGDVRSLSGGISEALITTKYGLIVAIPSLLLHAFLARKAKGILSSMESAAVGFVNQASLAQPGAGDDLPSVPVSAKPPLLKVPDALPDDADLVGA